MNNEHFTFTFTVYIYIQKKKIYDATVIDIVPTPSGSTYLELLQE
jgi:hypothetical protein